MKLTVEQVAKLAKLSPATVRVYASRLKLGTKEGKKRYYSKADVSKLTEKTSSITPKPKPIKKKKAKVAKIAKVTQKRSQKSSSKSASRLQKPADRQVPEARPELPPQKRSFWSFFQKKPEQKVALMGVKDKK